MRSVPITALILGGFLAIGCSQQSTEPNPETTWNWVRLHDGGTETYSDLSIDANGQFVLDTGSRGGASSARGLLAGERLETLARLIGELPLESYSAPGNCEGDFFLSVTRDDVATTYRGHDCDTNAPTSLGSLRGLLTDFAAEIGDPRRLDPDAVRLLAKGASSDIHAPREVVVENRDALFALLREHRVGGIVALPPVDFRNEVVVGVFAGQKPSGGYGLDLGSVESSEHGWLTVGIVATEPGSECLVTAASTQPFLLLAVKRSSGGLALDRRREVQNCGS